MERWENHRRHGHDTLPTASNYHRSFSSSLLDSIYRSIDESSGTGGVPQREGNADAIAMGNQLSRVTVDERKKSMASAQKPALPSRRGPSAQKPALPSRRGPAAMKDQPQQHHNSRTSQQQHHRQQRQRDRSFANSTSSSSDSSYGGFSSSDAEKPAALSATTPRPKPIRTSCAASETRKEKKLPKESNKQKTDQASIGDRFRASKLYRELKKVKPPVSPGARLASFLNTLFTAAGSTTKKAKAANPAAINVTRTAPGDASLCSSASSYSRSRLSRTPSSIGNAASGGETRRSVRFFPVSFVVDEDCRPRGHRWAHADQKPDYFQHGCPPPTQEVAETRRLPTREATREIIIAYEEKKRVEEEEDDGAWSYSSSDLFELENLGAIAVGGELPVYETTRLEGTAPSRRVSVCRKTSD